MGYARGRKWNDEEICKDLSKMINDMNMKTFPTHSEMVSYFGDRSLAVKISKSGGTRYWANLFNLPIKRCESEFGNEYELKAMKDILQNTGLTSYQTKPRYPYDLLVDSNIKVDVKVSRQFLNNSNTWQNTFNLEKRDPTCDLFMLYCLDKNGFFIKLIIIPSCVLYNQTQIGIGKDSKWNCYIDDWKLFHDYKKFYEKLIGEKQV